MRYCGIRLSPVRRNIFNLRKLPSRYSHCVPGVFSKKYSFESIRLGRNYHCVELPFLSTSLNSLPDKCCLGSGHRFWYLKSTEPYKGQYLQNFSEKCLSVSALRFAECRLLRLRSVLKNAALRLHGPVHKCVFKPLNVRLVEAVV